jgi:hypothetical protein
MSRQRIEAVEVMLINWGLIQKQYFKLSVADKIISCLRWDLQVEDAPINGERTSNVKRVRLAFKKKIQ